MPSSLNAPAKPRFTSALIVDDHPLFCDALSMTLQAVSEIRSVTTANSIASARHLLEAGQQPDLIALDLNLPDAQGLTGLIQMRALAAAPVLIVSSVADDRVISSAIHGGAAGFVPKHSQRDVFERALAAIATGEPFLPPGAVLLPPGRAQEEQDTAHRLASLTKQQTRILELICEGKLNKQIAYDLSIAETTVKAHVTAIMRKLGVQSRTQAVLLAKDASFANRLQAGG